MDKAPESPKADKKDINGNLHDGDTGQFKLQGKSESEDLESFEQLFALSELENSSNKNSLDKQKESKHPDSIDEISEYGRNDFDIFFSESGLEEHEKHLEDTACKDIEEYHEKAQKLIKSAVGGNICGFKTKSGLIVRYDKQRKLFVKGNFMRGDIIIMFRPYWDYRKRKPELKDSYKYFLQEEADKNND